jgi:hypothetical protein
VWISWRRGYTGLLIAGINLVYAALLTEVENGRIRAYDGGAGATRIVTDTKETITYISVLLLLFRQSSWLCQNRANQGTQNAQHRNRYTKFKHVISFAEY